jgi:selenocysteine-specific elongation factor
LTDAVTREGIDGATGLISLIDTMLSRVPTQKDMGRPRLWIDRSFAIEGVGTVVTGTLAGGTLEVGQSLVVEPGSRQVSIRGLQTHGTALAVSPPGRRLAVNLRGVHFSEIKRGQALVREGQWNHCESFDGELNVFPGLGHGVSNKGAYVACIGSGAYQGRIACLGATHEIPAGGRGHIRVWLQEGLPLCSGDRFVLRESGRQESVGGGTILEIMPKRPIRKTVPTSDVNQLIAMHGWIDPDELFRISGVRVAPNVGSWIVDPGTISATQSKLAAKLAANPLGIETIELDERERLMVLSMPNVEIHRGVAFQVGLPEPPFHPYLEALRANPYIPPPPTGVDSRSLRLLERRGLIVHSQDIWFARSALRSAAAVLRTHSMKVTEGLTVSEVRMVLKTSRRYALAILGWMDLNGWTQRTGDERSLTELAETQ